MFQKSVGQKDFPANGAFYVESGLGLREANHRISNNLSLLASTIALRSAEIARRGEDLSSEQAVLLLDEIISRIVTVGDLHRMLSTMPEADQLDLAESLRELCETLIAALSAPGKFELIWRGHGRCMVPTDKVLPLCLTVTEIVTNSLKYAHPSGTPGKITVACRMDWDGSLLLEIADDGVGLPEGFDLLRDGGLGTRTMRLLARNLDAELTLESRAIGVRSTLRLPPVLEMA